MRTYKNLYHTLLLSLLFVFIFSLTAFADESVEESSELESQYEIEENNVEWDNISFQIQDEFFFFPFYAGDLISNGWEIDPEYIDEENDPLRCTLVPFTKNNNTVNFYISNYSMEPQLVSEGIITGIDVSAENITSDECTVALSEGIELSYSTIEEAEDIYGEETTIYEEEDGQIIYEYSLFDSFDLTFYTDDNDIIQRIVYVNRALPDEIDDQISYAYSDRQNSYESPETLSDSFDEYQVNIQNKTYSIPAPVYAFLDDEWEIQEDDANILLVPNEETYVSFIKNDLEFLAGVKNLDDEIKPAVFCDVVSVEFSLDEETNYTDVVLPYQIQIGMNKDDVINILNSNTSGETSEDNPENGYYMEDFDDDIPPVDEDEELINTEEYKCIFGFKSNDSYYSVGFGVDENSPEQKYVVTSVSVSNS